MMLFDQRVRRLALVALLCTAFVLGFAGSAPVAQAKPDCGQCHDGTFDYDTLECIAGSASDCTECTVCAPAPVLPG
ncbi:MAG TPA: hypothetical protein VHQ65_11955 [Thermoanaerobaculia bacterium]|nr:hypothetical protein [Thermoanaerobaculia bacterium]